MEGRGAKLKKRASSSLQMIMWPKPKCGDGKKYESCISFLGLLVQRTIHWVA